MTASAHDDGAFPCLRLAGELDLVSCPDLRLSLDELADSNDRVVVDLQDVTFLGSAPLGLLIALDGRLTSKGGALAVVSNGADLQNIIELTGVDQVLHFFWDADAAQAYLHTV